MPILKEPDLMPGERKVFSKAANHFQGSRAVGGKLTVTDRRLVFLPHGFDKALAGGAWEVPLGEIGGVGVEPRFSGKAGLFGGGLRKRLRIRTSDGGEHLFVINGLGGAVEQLRGLRLPVE